MKKAVQKLRQGIQFCGFLLASASIIGANPEFLGSLDKQLFPDIGAITESEIYLKGLAALYPGRILFQAPQLNQTSQRLEAASVESLPKSIQYIRVYRLDEASEIITKLSDHPALIIDLRYLQSNSVGNTMALLLDKNKTLKNLIPIGEVPERVSFEIERLKYLPASRPYPAIVLCNRETAGPFEATLHNLQEQGSIIAIGEATKGMTGFYELSSSGAWLLSGELRPDEKTSLVSAGFQPRITVDLEPEESYRSYHLYEAGTPISALIATQNSPTAESAKDTQENPHRDTLQDRVLQYGVDTVAALQVLQQLPN